MDLVSIATPLADRSDGSRYPETVLQTPSAVFVQIRTVLGSAWINMADQFSLSLYLGTCKKVRPTTTSEPLPFRPAAEQWDIPTTTIRAMKLNKVHFKAAALTAKSL